MKPENLKLLRNIAVMLILVVMVIVILRLLSGGFVVFAILAVFGTVSICGLIGAFGWKWMVNMMLSVLTPVVLYSLLSILMGKFNIDGLFGAIVGWGALLSGIPFIIIQYKMKSIIALPIYVVLMSPVILMYMLVFACAYFGDCL